MGGIELHLAIAPGADEAITDLRERGRSIERAVDRNGVGPVKRLARRARVERDRQLMPGRRVDDARITAAVARSSAAVAIDARVVANVEVIVEKGPAERNKAAMDQDRVARGIGQIVGRDLVAAALRGAGDATNERTRIRAGDRIGHVAGLEIGEAQALRDDE